MNVHEVLVMRGVLGLLCVVVLGSFTGCGMGSLTQETMRASAPTTRPKTAAPSNQPDPPAAPEAPANPTPPAPGAQPATPVAQAPAPGQPTAPPNQTPPPAGSQPPAAAAGAKETPEKPSDPLSAALVAQTAMEIVVPRLNSEELLPLPKRRAHAIMSMRKIGLALGHYQHQYSEYPRPAIVDASGKPLLSWRVLILPYLGQMPLFEKFRLNEPWDSPHNQALLSEIPPEYQSPERMDEKTNYLVPYGKETLFPGSVAVKQVVDSPGATVMLLEVDNDQAVPWTKPADFTLNPRQIRAGLGRLRGDGVFVVWANGNVARLLPDKMDQNLFSLFTMDGDESFNVAALSQPATAEPDPHFAAMIAVGETMLRARIRTDSGGSQADESNAPILEAPAFAAEDYDALASAAFANGLEGDGLDYTYAAMLASPQSCTESWKWVSGLARPAMAVRFGIGVQYIGPRGIEPSQTTIGQSVRSPEGILSGRALQALQQVTGELGDRILTEIELRRARGAGGALLNYAPEVQPEGAQTDLATSAIVPLLTPGISYLGCSNQKQILQLAAKEGVDVALLINVTVKPTRSGRPRSLTTMGLWDVRRRKSLYESSAISNFRVAEARQNRLVDDPVPVVLERICGFMDANLEPGNFPSSLTSVPVAGRVTALTGRSHKKLLPVLAEIRFYYDRKLMTYPQYADAFRKMLGDVAGDQLAGGTHEERCEVLKPLLPKTPPVTPQRQARAADE